MNEQIDVMIVGAGPVGLLTAIELTLSGVQALVVERLAAPSMVTKALGIGTLGTEALQRRGMGAAFVAAEARSVAAMKQFADRRGPDTSGRSTKIGGHFGGLKMLRQDVQAEPDRRARLVDQQAIEAMLAERIDALEIEVRRGCEVTGFAQNADGVDVEWASEDGGSGRVRCAYLVGCDGGRSAVRKMAGFAFPGADPTMTMYTAIVGIDHPERLGSAGWQRTSEGVFSYGAFPNRVIMLDFSGPPADRQAPVTREEIEGVLRRISGEDVRVTVLESGSRWTDNTRLVDTYRQGRVLLAGDAAHIHSPFGGQGMSLGLVDAANLGWKLAAVVRGEKPDTLLDTYTAERRPVAEAVLANTLAQASIMRPDPQSGAMRDLFAKLLGFDDVNRLIGQMTSGLVTRYDLGSERDEVGRLLGDRPIRDGEADTSLYEVMRNGKGIFLDVSRHGTTSKLVAARTTKVRCVPIESGPSLLIRPDACAAWAGEGDSTDGLEEALRRWF